MKGRHSKKAINTLQQQAGSITICFCIAFLSGFLLFSCSGSENIESSIESAEKEAQEIITSYSEKKQEAQFQLEKAASQLFEKQDSSSRIEYALAKGNLVSFEIQSSQSQKTTLLLEEDVPLKLETKEQLLYIVQKGKGRINTSIDSIFLYAQQLQLTKSKYPYRLNGRSISLQLSDSLLRSSRNPFLKKRVWLASQLPSDSVYKYWNLYRYALNNSVSTSFGSDMFTYRAFEIGLTPIEINEFCKQTIDALKPLFEPLATHYRSQLATKYRQKIPEYIPVHWFPDGKGVNWNLNDYSYTLLELTQTISTTQQKRIFERYLSNIGLIRNSNKDRNNKNALNGKFTHTIKHDGAIIASQNLFNSFGGLSLENLEEIANNSDIPPIMKGELNPIFTEFVFQLAKRLPHSNQFWQDEQLLSRYNAPDPMIHQLHQVYNDLMYCMYVASIVTPIQQLYYTQSYDPRLINEYYWDLMQSQMGIIYPGLLETQQQFPGIPDDVMIAPLDHFIKMQAILRSYQWLFENSDDTPTEFYIKKTIQHGIELHNVAYKGVRFQTDNLTKPVNPQFMANYFLPLVNMLTDSISNPIQSYPILD